MKDLIALAAALAVSMGNVHAQSGPPGMPPLTRAVNAPQEAKPVGGGALSLAGGSSSRSSSTGSKGVTRTMVDTSSKPAPVPAGLAAAALETPISIDPSPLPAAMDLMGDVTYQRSQIAPGRTAINELTLKPGRNEMVQIARNHLNRFVTPFARPAVKSTSSTTTTKVEGSIVYLATASLDPVGIFIVDEENPVNAISLTVMPRDVPAVSMNLRLDEYAAAPMMASAGRRQATEEADDFASMLRETFRTIALGEVPAGFGMKRVAGYNSNMPECVLPGLRTAPAQEIANGAIIVIVSKLTNITRIPQSVDESKCASDRVLAVAAWPHVELMPGQSTELYIAVRREMPQSSSARPSVL